jgi:hypothetical protein
MTKQEQIRESIKDALREVCFLLIADGCPHKPQWDCEKCDYADEGSLRLMKKLDSQGVVIKSQLLPGALGHENYYRVDSLIEEQK